MTLVHFLENYYLHHHRYDELAHLQKLSTLQNIDQAQNSVSHSWNGGENTKAISQPHSELHEGDLSIPDQLLIVETIKALIDSEKEKKYQFRAQPSKPIKLAWFGQKQLDLFVDDLIKTFQGMKSKKQIYLLFDTRQADFKIELPSRHLPPLLCLFYELHQTGAIKVNGNRGLFVYLHEHFIAPQQDFYPKRNFRKLRYDAMQNLRIKKQISKMIKPLLDKYCS